MGGWRNKGGASHGTLCFWESSAVPITLKQVELTALEEWDRAGGTGTLFLKSGPDQRFHECRAEAWSASTNRDGTICRDAARSFVTIVLFVKHRQAKKKACLFSFSHPSNFVISLTRRSVQS